MSGVGSDVGWIDSMRGDMMRAACGVRNCSWCCCSSTRWSVVDVEVVVVWLEERRSRFAGVPRRLPRKPPSIVSRRTCYYVLSSDLGICHFPRKTMLLFFLLYGRVLSSFSASVVFLVLLLLFFCRVLISSALLGVASAR